MDKRQRSGILFLTLLIIIGIVALYFQNSASYSVASDVEELALRRKIDSLKQLKLAEVKDTIYPFNPNYITDYRGYTLGMKVEEIDKLHAFRESDKWINSAADFQEVTGVSDSLLAAISPYFKFPDWVTNPKPSSKKEWSKKTVAQKKDLNAATAEDLKTVDGVTQDLAQAIIQYRERYNGFAEDFQLYDVDGLPAEVVRAIRDGFTVKTKPEVKKLNVNTASASDLSVLPFMNYRLARDIVDYRNLHEGIDSIAQLKKIQGITPFTFDRIKLYLLTDQR